MAPFGIERSRTFNEDVRRLREAGVEVEKEECFEAVKDALSRNPLVGRVVDPANGVRMMFGHRRNAMPLVFYYRYVADDRRVRLIGVTTVRM